MSHPTDLGAANRAILDLYTRIGGNIRAARDQRGTTQADLGRSVGLTRGSITNIELGNQHPGIHMLIAIAQALEVDYASLIGGDAPALASPTAGMEKLVRRLTNARDQLDTVIANLEGKTDQ